MMNAEVRKLSSQFLNPFRLKHIQSIHKSDFDLFGPSVVMASPGFLQSGISRQLFEAWCDDERNGVIIAGYTVEGTLAHELLSDPKEIRCLDNRIKPRRCRIDVISFSAHVDFQHNKQFIRTVLPDCIVLVHGEKKQMKQLKDALEQDIKRNWPIQRKPDIAMPENGVKVRFRFKKHVVASVVGSAAVDMLQRMDEQQLQIQQHSLGSTPLPDRLILVTENFASKVVADHELAQYTSCRFGSITEKLHIPLPSDVLSIFASSHKENSSSLYMDTLIQLINDRLSEIFDEVRLVAASELLVQKSVYVRFVTSSSLSASYTGKGTAPVLSGLEVQWQASPVADLVADSVSGLLMQLFSASQIVKMTLAAASSTAMKGERRKTHVAPKDLKGPPSATKRQKVDDDVLARVDRGEIDPMQKTRSDLEVLRDQHLQKIREILVSDSNFPKYFSELILNKEGEKLIFRSLPDSRYIYDNDGNIIVEREDKKSSDCVSNIPLEGFVIILPTSKDLDATTILTQAVISCDNEGFRKAIIKFMEHNSYKASSEAGQ